MFAAREPNFAALLSVNFGVAPNHLKARQLMTARPGTFDRIGTASAKAKVLGQHS